VLKYIGQRLLLMLPTFFGVTLLSFVIINLAPGSPIDQKIQQIRMATGGSMTGDAGVSAEMIEALKAQYGFDKPLLVRYGIWLKNILTLNFGESFVFYEPAMNVIVSKFPVSIQFGLVSLFLTYLICIPLGVFKAVKDGSRFDSVSSVVLFVLYSVPSVMLGVLLIVFFSGGSFFDWFPIGGLYSDNYESLSFLARIWDRAVHAVLPLTCYVFGNFTVLTLLMKNSLIDEIKSDYVRTARAKGLSENAAVYKHALRNALIPLMTGIGSFLGFFLSGSVIIETVFNLDGIGLLMFQSMLSRDYNVIMALLFLSTLVAMLGRLVSDILYVVVDPRIDFS
jgi:microcin C transport system permease protein